MEAGDLVTTEHLPPSSGWSKNAVCSLRDLWWQVQVLARGEKEPPMAQVSLIGAVSGKGKGLGEERGGFGQE